MVTIRFPPHGETDSPYIGTLQVTTDAPDNGSPTAHLTGLSLINTVTVSPLVLDFGDRNVGSRGTIRVTLENRSQCNAHISGTEVEGDLAEMITVGSLAGTLHPGATRWEAVHLDCADIGDLNATLRVRSPKGVSLGSTSLIGSCVQP